MRLAARLEPVYAAFIEEVQGHMSPGTVSRLEMWIVSGGGHGLSFYVREKDKPRGNLIGVNADAGEPEIVAGLIEAQVMEFWPWLVSTD